MIRDVLRARLQNGRDIVLQPMRKFLSGLMLPQVQVHFRSKDELTTQSGAEL